MDVDPAIGLVVRRLTLGSGPLKRTPDRIQAWLRLALAVLLLAAAPIGMAVGTAAREHAQTTAADERRQLIEVRAVLTEDAHPVSGGALADAVLVPATWRGAPGSRHAGQVFAPPGTPADTAVTAWVDADGGPRRPPATDSAIAVRAVTLGVVGALAVANGAVLVHLVAVWSLDRWRDRRWAAEWSVVGPVWVRDLS